MKLLTKAWYQTMQNSGLGLQLQVDDRAAVFSEAVFQEAWEKKLYDRLAMREDICYEYDEPWDEEEERRYFEECHRRELESFQSQTPPRILNKVADIRMLALGFCTEEVYADFKEYREWCRSWTEKTLEEAWNMRCAQGLEKAWTGDRSLHDAVVLSLNREGENLLIEFECEDPEERLRDIREYDPELLEERGEEAFLFPEIKAVRFRDARILKQEKTPEKAYWLYDEIWRTDEGLEVHALLWHWEDSSVFELTIACRDTELIWTVPPRTE